ncbi:MAG: MerR family transcriptional regulator [Betaproteobacteria bacterium]|jgi:DNA-binding transcriptional MerR regulator|nr:MerR family transcriptional regulator [Betaproteobacteria bacterium]
METIPTYSFTELCKLVELPSRTIRYYIQQGLAERPDGMNRGAKYTGRHVEQLLTIKKWQAAGLSLQRIRELLHGNSDCLPPTRQEPGTIAVWSRLQVAPGIEVNVEAGSSGLSSKEISGFFQQVLSAYQGTRDDSSIPDGENSGE